jgi:hypothetical protein
MQPAANPLADRASIGAPAPVAARRQSAQLLAAGVLSVLAICADVPTAAAQSGPDGGRNVQAPGPAAQAAATPRVPTLGMAVLAAQVLSDGTLMAGAGATGVNRVDTGIYEVAFDRDVSQCSYSAVSFVGTYPMSVKLSDGDPNAVHIEFSNRTGNSNADSRFYLTVFCVN